MEKLEMKTWVCFFSHNPRLICSSTNATTLHPLPRKVKNEMAYIGTEKRAQAFVKWHARASPEFPQTAKMWQMCQQNLG
jgi:hypothetical protein